MRKTLLLACLAVLSLSASAQTLSKRQVVRIANAEKLSQNMKAFSPSQLVKSSSKAMAKVASSNDVNGIYITTAYDETDDFYETYNDTIADATITQNGQTYKVKKATLCGDFYVYGDYDATSNTLTVPSYQYASDEKQVYLIIEEINRGNCAQIFGDLFQLLDRKNGRSEFFIIPDAELRKHLAKEGLMSNKLILPENLHLLATMNTSDQSLFPMDSAFKRRWAMEYVPIKLDHEVAKEFTFKVNKIEYSWVAFLDKINPLIRKATDSEDKQMGEFFIKGDINEDEFKNKVMFYIWNDVCKDLYSASRISPLYFMRSDASDGNKNVFTFAELYGKGRKNEEGEKDSTPTELLDGFITQYLKLKPKNAKSEE